MKFNKVFLLAHLHNCSFSYWSRKNLPHKIQLFDWLWHTDSSSYWFILVTAFDICNKASWLANFLIAFDSYCNKEFSLANCLIAYDSCSNKAFSLVNQIWQLKTGIYKTGTTEVVFVNFQIFKSNLNLVIARLCQVRKKN